MLSIDTYAYTNRLKKAHPAEKMLFALITLGVCLSFEEMLLYLFVIVSLTVITIAGAKIPLKFYLKVLALPLPFVLVGVLTVIIDVSRNPASFDYHLQLFSLFFGVTQKSLSTGQIIFFRTYSCVSCLYFLSLTTPIIDIAWIMRKIKIPAVFVEILSIIYRFIFELMDTALLIRTSQESRLGYADFKRAYRSLGLLISNVFAKSLQNYKALSMAMASRLYNGDFRVIEEHYDFSIRNILFMGTYFMALVFLIVWKRFGS